VRALVGALLVAIVLAASFASPARADDKAQAAAHYKQGKAFFDAKQYDQAIAEYQQAYTLDHVTAHLFNIGRAFHLKGDLKSAIEFYQKFLAADPASSRADEVRGHIASATQQLADEDARRRASEEAVRIAAEQQKAREAQEQKKVAAIAHVKQAEAYAQAGAWAKAGEEHRAAATVDRDPQHLLDAGDAFRKQPDLARARDAFLAYLEQVPLGDNSDQIRAKVAELTRAIEKADEDERQRKLRESLALARTASEPRPPGVDLKPRHKSSHRGWIVVGGALLLTGLVADLVPPNTSNGRLDASDFAPPVLYGLGAAAVLGGVF